MKKFLWPFTAVLTAISLFFAAASCGGGGDGGGAAPDSLEIVEGDIGLAVNGVKQLNITVSPAKADTDVTWESSDNNVAMVNASGRVTGKAGGTAFITAASARNAEIKDSITVTVKAATLNNYSLNLEIGGTFDLAAGMKPADASATYEWVITSAPAAGVVSLSNDNSANPTVSADGEGTAIIKVAVTSGGKKHLAECTVTVSDNSAPGGPDPNFHIYLCFGQSNMEGVNNSTNHFIPEEYRSWTDGRFKVLAAVDMPKLNPPREKENWYTAAPPLVRQDRGLCPADNFGRTLVEKIDEPDIKIGVIIVAISGAALDAFDKANYIDNLTSGMADSWNLYGNKPYARLVELAKMAQGDGVIKGILMHQIESGGGTPSWADNVRRIYEDLLTDLDIAPKSIPLLAGKPAIQTHGNMWRINELNIKNPGYPFHIIESEGCAALQLPGQSDGSHFSPAGMMELGKRYGEKIYGLLYEQP
jgi:hypothetical protein